VLNRAADVLRMAAQSLKDSQSALGAFFRRLKAGLGPSKAITATAKFLRSMARGSGNARHYETLQRFDARSF